MREARGGRAVDFAKLREAVGADEKGLAEVLTAMAASGATLAHGYATGKKPDADDAAWLADYRAQLADAGVTEAAPDGRLRQDAQDLLPWACGVATDFVGNDLSAFDLIQESALGLTEALAAGLPEKDFAAGVRLWCQYRALCALSVEPDWDVYPAAELQLVDAWLRAKRDLARQGAHDPDDDAMAAKMGRTPDEAAQAAALVAAQAAAGRPFQLPDDE